MKFNHKDPAVSGKCGFDDSPTAEAWSDFFQLWYCLYRCNFSHAAFEDRYELRRRFCEAVML